MELECFFNLVNNMSNSTPLKSNSRPTKDLGCMYNLSQDIYAFINCHQPQFHGLFVRELM